jgi:hypothetical protein
VYSAPVELNTTDINDLNKIAALREAEMDKHSVQYLEAQIESPVCPVGALSVAVLFARDAKNIPNKSMTHSPFTTIVSALRAHHRHLTGGHAFRH